jgi:hypothetical protein
MSENRPDQALPITSRREFLTTVGAVAATAAFPGALRAATDRKTRYAIVGSGHRGTSMWGAETLARHGDALELVGLCDINPLRAKAANTVMARAPRCSPTSTRC